MWQALEEIPLGLALLLGWLLGSFFNQFVDRTPHRAATAEDEAAAERLPVPTLLRPFRSVCLSCRAVIPWHENLPIVSYLLLNGRCRRCGAAIGRRTLAVEIATPLAFAAYQQLNHLLAGSDAGRWLPAFPWGYFVVGWLLVAGLLLVERRKVPGWFLLLGAVLAVGGWRPFR